MHYEHFKLPELVLMEACGGHFPTYISLIYQYFVQDFVETKPVFRGKRLGLKAFPKVDGKECTFYHMTHEGEDESSRTPDIRRMERIRWPRPLIDDSHHPYLKVWRNKRGKEDRVLIFHEEEGYLMVLADRGDYVLPWTAYLVTEHHRRKKLLKEYHEYIKGRSRPG